MATGPGCRAAKHSPTLFVTQARRIPAFVPRRDRATGLQAVEREAAPRGFSHHRRGHCLTELSGDATEPPQKAGLP
jgi:hypothetical protein